MADKLSFSLVSPERKLAEVEADMVVIPGAEGDFGALPGHAPFLTTLRPGVVTVTNGSEKTEYVVTGGFAEVSGEGAAVLAEEAVERAEAAGDWMAEKVSAAEAALSSAADDGKQAAGQRLDDYKALAQQIG
ncbi:MAG: ATP synthase F1 subunit epsilon [Pseudomonadota bacterium]